MRAHLYLFLLSQFNTTKIRMEYSELRFNKHYILWYQNVAKLLLTGKSSS